MPKKIENCNSQIILYSLHIPVLILMTFLVVLGTVAVYVSSQGYYEKKGVLGNSFDNTAAKENVVLDYAVVSSSESTNTLVDWVLVFWLSLVNSRCEGSAVGGQF